MNEEKKPCGEHCRCSGAKKDSEEKFSCEELQQKAGEYLDGWKRCQADFENYKKQQAKSREEFSQFAATNTALQLLPVVDNFHISTDHIPEENKNDPWVAGILHIRTQLEGVLSEIGIAEIPVAEGDEFDPNIHEAVREAASSKQQAADGNAEESRSDLAARSDLDRAEERQMVRKVLRRGYKIGERVIRASQVVVK